MLAPDWPSAVWYPRLSCLAVESILIEREMEMFIPGDLSLPARLPPPKWNLRAFHLVPRVQTARRGSPRL